jgi:serine/threonine protein kinase
MWLTWTLSFCLQLLDLGISAKGESVDPCNRMQGTPIYMAPEVSPRSSLLGLAFTGVGHYLSPYGGASCGMSSMVSWLLFGCAIFHGDPRPIFLVASC